MLESARYKGVKQAQISTCRVWCTGNNRRLASQVLVSLGGGFIQYAHAFVSFGAEQIEGLARRAQFKFGLFFRLTVEVRFRHFQARK